MSEDDKVFQDYLMNAPDANEEPTLTDKANSLITQTKAIAERLKEVEAALSGPRPDEEKGSPGNNEQWGLDGLLDSIRTNVIMIEQSVKRLNKTV